MRPRGVEELSIRGGRAAAACWKDVRVGIEGRPGKRRGPWAVWLLAVVTCGVYGLVWYFRTNRELRDCGAGIKVRPVLCVLALLPGVVLCYVPLFTSIYRTGERIRRAQARAGLEPSCSPGLALLLVFALGTWPVYYQAQVNKAWVASAPDADDATREAEADKPLEAQEGLEAQALSADAASEDAGGLESVEPVEPVDLVADKDAPESPDEPEAPEEQPEALEPEAHEPEEPEEEEAEPEEGRETEPDQSDELVLDEAAEPERADSAG